MISVLIGASVYSLPPSCTGTILRAALALNHSML